MERTTEAATLAWVARVFALYSAPPAGAVACAHCGDEGVLWGDDGTVPCDEPGCQALVTEAA